MLDSMLQKYDIQTSDQLFQAYREIVQEIILAGLWKGDFFQKGAFYGGTALRILYGLDRFSEDLDFSLLEPDPHFSLPNYFPFVAREFEALSIPIGLSSKKKRNQSQVQSAFLKTNSHIHSLSVQIPTQRKIKVKIEVDTDPPLGFETEEKLLIQPFSFYVKTYSKPDLFAGKLHALLFRTWKKRVKGRDFYDFEWYVRNGIPLNLNHFRQRALQSGDIDATSTISNDEVKELLCHRFMNVDFDQVLQDIRPFVKKPRDERLNLWSSTYFKDLLEHLKICQ